MSNPDPDWSDKKLRSLGNLLSWIATKFLIAAFFIGILLRGVIPYLVDAQDTTLFILSLVAWAIIPVILSTFFVSTFIDVRKFLNKIV